MKNLYDVYGVNLDLTVYYIDNQSGTKYGNLNPKEIDRNAKAQQIETGDVEFKKAIEEKLKSLGIEIDPELGITVGNVSSIQDLTLDGNINKIEDLSPISELTALKNLTLKNLNIQNLNGLDNCLLLEYLYLDTCMISDLDNGFNSLQSLVKLNTLFMKLPDTIDEAIANNQVLGLSNGLKNAELLKELKKFGVFGDDTAFKLINNSNIPLYSDFTGQDDGWARNYAENSYTGKVKGKLSNISYIDNFNTEVKKSIKKLYLFQNNLNSLNSLKSFSNISELWIFGNNNLNSLDGLQNHKNLVNLIAFSCGLLNFNGLEGCSSLDFILSSGSNINSLAGLEKLDFTYIYCDNCSNLIDVTALGTTNEDKKSVHSKLNRVSFRNCENLEDVSHIGVATSIRYLFLTGCKATTESMDYWIAIDDVVGLCGSKAMLPEICSNWLSNSNVRNLAVDSPDKSYTDNSPVIEKLRNMTKVTRLSLKNNSQLTNDYLNEILSTMTGMEYLQLYGCSGLTSCAFLSNMNNLKELDIRGTNITDLTVLNTAIKDKKITKLQTLVIDNISTDMTKIQDVINKLYSATDGNDFSSWVDAGYCINRGLCLVGDGYNFSNCKSIENFKSACNYDSGTIDLSSCTNLKNFHCKRSSRTYILPSSLKTYFSRARAGIDNLSRVLHLTSFSSDESANNFPGVATKFNRNGLIDSITLSRYGTASGLSDLSFINNFSTITQQSVKTFKKVERDIYSLSSVSGLEKLTGLQTLYLGSVNLNDLSFLNGMNSLVDITLLDTKVDDWTTLSVPVSLTSLTIKDSNISGFNFLKSDNSTLTTVNISLNSTFSNLTGISHLKNIQTLDLSSNSISNLSELKDLINSNKTTLKTLTLDSNPIGNTSVFETDNIEVLKALKATGTQTISCNNCNFSSGLEF